MRKGRLFPALFLLIVAALFVYGMVEILILRFEKGDVYPPYSSYRPDPLGTKAFYEGLGLLQGVEAVRNVEPLPKVSGLSGSILFLFGFERGRFSVMERSTAEALEDAALGGGRVVISFVPTEGLLDLLFEDKRKQEARQKDGSQEKDDEQGREQILLGKEHVDLCKRWSVETERSKEKGEEATLSEPERDLPASLPWYSPLVFKPQDNSWRTLYTRAGNPVLIERSYGKGSIVLSSDSFFLSNEAMKSRRYPQLLSWLCGAHQKIIFDETHLGVVKSPGIATLLRKYGLGPFFVSLMVLALLAIWKQSARFVPPYEEDEEAGIDAGKDAFTGLTNLLRRNIPSDYVLTACLEEWKRSFTHGKQNRSALLPHMQKIIHGDRARPRKDRNPVEAYRKISALGRRR